MKLGAFEALKNRDFACYLASSFLWTVGSAVQAVAIGWQVYDLTGDPFQLGLVGLMEFLPTAVLALPAGTLADRIDRRLLLIVGVVAEVALALTLTGLALMGAVSVPALLAVALGFGIARALANPAFRALLPLLLAREDLGRAVAWSSTSWQVAMIGGPALGGWLYAAHPAAAYGATALSLAVALGAVMALRKRPAAPGGRGMGLVDLVAGLPFVFRHPLLLGAISLDLFAVLFSGALALLPVFAKDVLMTGPGGLGLLRSAPALGAVVTALLLVRRPLDRHVGRRLFQAIGLFGCAALVFGLSRDFWLSFAALGVLGAADMVSMYVRGTLVPLATPDSYRGRVMAIEAVFIGASNELGAFVAGSAAALLGAIATVIAGGALTVAVAAIWWRLFPALRQVDRMTEVGDFTGAGRAVKVAPESEGRA